MSTEKQGQLHLGEAPGAKEGSQSQVFITDPFTFSPSFSLREVLPELADLSG